MPITLSDAELSRWIAEKMEPLSSLPNEDDCDSADMQDFPTDCWIASFRLSLVTGMHVPGWQPRDMVNDPAMTVMLMERAGIGVEPTTNGFDGKRQDCWQAYPLDFSKDPFRIYAFTGYGSIGRAVMEAFALANGYHEEPL